MNNSQRTRPGNGFFFFQDLQRSLLLSQLLRLADKFKEGIKPRRVVEAKKGTSNDVDEREMPVFTQ